MNRHVNWGILGAAQIATESVIPALQKSKYCRVLSIASRDPRKADLVAQQFGIPRVYRDYQQLLNDPDLDVVYIPLPNHLHFEWTLKAIQHGKHVLCEKPLALTKTEVKKLITARDSYGVRISEAFMVRNHPQWLKSIELVTTGAIGKLKSIQCTFGYFDDDPASICNLAEFGGGALWDIGVYPIHISRWAFAEEPRRVCATMSRDPNFKTDTLTSAILEFPSGHASFQCSTLSTSHQSVSFIGDKKRLDIEIPFNAPTGKPCRLFLSEKNSVLKPEEIISIEACDQYTFQGDAFSQAILNASQEPVTLENSLWNTATVETLIQAADSGRWETVSV